MVLATSRIRHGSRFSLSSCEALSRALPKGAASADKTALDRRDRPGHPDFQFIAEQIAGLNRVEAYAKTAEILHLAVEALRDGSQYPWDVTTNRLWKTQA